MPDDLRQLEKRITAQFDRMDRRFDGLVSRREFDALKADFDEFKRDTSGDKRQNRAMFVGSFLYPVLIAVIVALVLTGR
jgi:hypothetical protein